MMLNNSESKVNKIITVIFAMSAAIGLVCQVIGILSFTKTRIGKKIRKGILKGSCAYMDDAIDVVQTRMPEWEEKLG